ncbi:hypothetical protein R1flu_026237 [Riccia fluitans]|uniref:Uncharacterized protein n=1 Tax=Riccia fluitans TaxID=41844 RepID=A0ABD1XFZ3_9MARC
MSSHAGRRERRRHGHNANDDGQKRSNDEAECEEVDCGAGNMWQTRECKAVRTRTVIRENNQRSDEVLTSHNDKTLKYESSPRDPND